jgi:hypothetical protein
MTVIFNIFVELITNLTFFEMEATGKNTSAKAKLPVKPVKSKIDGLPKRNFGFAKYYVTITDDLFEDDLKN